jgi:transcriptional regulator with XRE-family HTH domain
MNIICILDFSYEIWKDYFYMSKNIATEGKRIKYVRELLKLSLTEFATPLGKHLSAVQKWESNGRKLDKSNLLLLEKIWSINPDFIRHGHGEPFISQYEGAVATGFVYDILGKPFHESVAASVSAPIAIVLPEIKSNSNNVIFVKVDNVNVPGLAKGDIVGVRLQQPCAMPDRLDEGQYLLISEGYITLKYMCMLEDGTVVSVENNAKSQIGVHLSLVHRDGLLIVGRVFSVLQSMEQYN